MNAGHPHPASRDSIHVEDARLVQHEHLAANQHVLRLHAPLTAAAARPGSFVHMRCDPALPMRRPMSIMRADPDTGYIDILYKCHGSGTDLLARRQKDEHISLIGPIGNGFKLAAYRSRPLLIGGGVGIPPMIFLAEHMKDCDEAVEPLVIMGSEIPFPFTVKPSRLLVPGLPDGSIGAMPLLDDWGIASRLASQQDLPGCFNGLVTDLARAWLDKRSDAERRQVELFTCGPTPMLAAVARLAAEYDLPCQASLEEYMACAVGGCAGCVVRVQDGGEVAMRRVCVDGPVFEAATVFG